MAPVFQQLIDYDGDSMPDLIEIDMMPRFIRSIAGRPLIIISKNMGNGQFVPTWAADDPSITFNNPMNFAHAADINGDRCPELFIFYSQNSGGLFFPCHSSQSGNQRIGIPQQFDLGFTAGSGSNPYVSLRISAITTASLDQSSRLKYLIYSAFDLFGGVSGVRAQRFYENARGNLMIHPQPEFFANSISGSYVIDLEAKDFNGDGLEDIAALEVAPNGLWESTFVFIPGHTNQLLDFSNAQRIDLDSQFGQFAEEITAWDSNPSQRGIESVIITVGDEPNLFHIEQNPEYLSGRSPRYWSDQASVVDLQASIQDPKGASILATPYAKVMDFDQDGDAELVSYHIINSPNGYVGSLGPRRVAFMVSSVKDLVGGQAQIKGWQEVLQRGELSAPGSWFTFTPGFGDFNQDGLVDIIAWATEETRPGAYSPRQALIENLSTKPYQWSLLGRAGPGGNGPLGVEVNGPLYEGANFNIVVDNLQPGQVVFFLFGRSSPAEAPNPRPAFSMFPGYEIWIDWHSYGAHTLPMVAQVDPSRSGPYNGKVALRSPPGTSRWMVPNRTTYVQAVTVDPSAPFGIANTPAIKLEFARRQD